MRTFYFSHTALSLLDLSYASCLSVEIGWFSPKGVRDQLPTLSGDSVSDVGDGGAGDIQQLNKLNEEFKKQQSMFYEEENKTRAHTRVSFHHNMYLSR